MGSSHTPKRISRATDGGCALEVMYCKGEVGAAGEACCSCSSAPEIQAKWISCSVGSGSPIFCIAQIHIYHGQISGWFIHVGCIPEWYFL